MRGAFVWDTTASSLLFSLKPYSYDLVYAWEGEDVEFV
jgi:hypothetical protein